MKPCAYSVNWEGHQITVEISFLGTSLPIYGELAAVFIKSPVKSIELSDPLSEVNFYDLVFIGTQPAHIAFQLP